MNWWQALVLGVLQGFTEYLPISSSGHLALGGLIFALHMPISVDILLHFATLIPTIWVFRHKIGILCCSFVCLLGNVCRPNNSSAQRRLVAAELRYILLLLLITAFTFAIAYPQKNLGLKFKPAFIALAFLLSASVLLLQHFLLRHRQPAANILQRISRRKFLLLAAGLGIAQGLAAAPGISRSGMTISVALLLGLKRREAGELSFIISIPVILGALLLDAKELLALVNGELTSILLAFAAACIGGFVALRLLLILLDKGNLYVFSIYLLVLSAFTFIYWR